MSQETKKPSLFFLRVTDGETKVSRLVQTIARHVQNGQRVLISVQDEQAKLYLDNLLWQQPAEGFLPHICSDEASNEPVVITSMQRNLNQADILFNLSSSVSPMIDQFSIVYELQDMTTPERHELSKEKLESYKKSGVEVQER